MAQYEIKRTYTYGGQIQLEGGGQVTTTLDRYVAKALPEDILTVMRSIAAEELQQQVDLNNPPTVILVDGRSVGQRGINQAMRKVSMRFGNAELVIQAAVEAYKLMRKITRIQNPPKNDVVARKHFHLYVDGKDRGLLPMALQTLTKASVKNDTVVRIVGPLVPYGRKLYFNPIGRQKKMSFTTKTSASGFTRFTYSSKYQPRFKPYAAKTLRRFANRFKDPAGALSRLQKANPGYVEGANQIAKRILRANSTFKSLYISDAWVSYAPAGRWGKSSKNDRVPSISVQMAKKGAVRVSLK